MITLRKQAFVLFFSLCGLRTLVASPLPTRLEPIYAEAVIAYNQKDFATAIKYIDEGLKTDPNQQKFLELKALSLKDEGNLPGAAETYRKLLQVGKTAGRSRNELSSYLFELGLIHYHQKNYDAAKVNLQASLEAHFNVAAAHFFLGLTDYEKTSWDSAREHFEAVIEGDVKSLKPTAHLYLAQLSSQLSDASGAVRQYARARKLARIEAASEVDGMNETKILAKHVIKTVDGQVRNFDRSVFVANVGIVSGYDSNVLSTPNESVDAGVKPASFKETLQYGITYATVPLASWQLVSSYRGNINYNFNQETKTGQFFNQDLALYLTSTPLELTNYGFKAQGLGTLQYQTTAGTSNGKFGAYSLGGSFGPFGKYEILPKWVLGIDAFFAPTKNYLDSSTTATQHKSGWEQSLQLSVTREEPRVYWNPGVFLSGVLVRTSGEEYRAKKIGLSVGNTMFLTEKTFFGITAGYSHTAFTERSLGTRLDDMFTAGTSVLQRLTRKLSATGELNFSDNFSNVSTYRYKRLVASLGLTYSF